MLLYAGSELGIFCIVFTGLPLEVDVVERVVAGCLARRATAWGENKLSCLSRPNHAWPCSTEALLQSSTF